MKPVWNVEVVIDGINTKITEKEITKLYLEETHYTCKKDQNSKPMIKCKNQYELKHR